MKVAIRKFWREAAAVVGLVLLALVVATYILSQQSFRFPLVLRANPRHSTSTITA